MPSPTTPVFPRRGGAGAGGNESSSRSSSSGTLLAGRAPPSYSCPIAVWPVSIARTETTDLPRGPNRPPAGSPGLRRAQRSP